MLPQMTLSFVKFTMNFVIRYTVDLLLVFVQYILRYFQLVKTQFQLFTCHTFLLANKSIIFCVKGPRISIMPIFAHCLVSFDSLVFARIRLFSFVNVDGICNSI